MSEIQPNNSHIDNLHQKQFSLCLQELLLLMPTSSDIPYVGRGMRGNQVDPLELEALVQGYHSII
jgi:hypothetical protein